MSKPSSVSTAKKVLWALTQQVDVMVLMGMCIMLKSDRS